MDNASTVRSIGTSTEAWLLVLGGGILALVIIGLAWATPGIIGDRLDLDVTTHENRNGLAAVQIINAGAEEIQINKVLINKRADCTDDKGIVTAINMMALAGRSKTLKVGDKIGIASGCKILSVEIGTDKGEATYSFR